MARIEENENSPTTYKNAIQYDVDEGCWTNDKIRFKKNGPLNDKIADMSAKNA